MYNLSFLILLVGLHLAQAQLTGIPVEQLGREKIGLAPHNRPSCQLPSSSVSNQRRTTVQVPINSSPEEIKIPIIDSTQNKSSITPVLGNNSKNWNSPDLDKQSKTFDSSERLGQLRQLLSNNNYDAYLVTPNDEHGTEYVTDYDRRLRFISGFTGSNGYALILMDKAVLFTDGRYQLQADQELDCNWWLIVGDEPEADIYHWLRTNNIKAIKIATDARLMSLQTFELVDEGIKRLDSEFALISQDLIDVVWHNQVESGESTRIAPTEPIFVHNLKFAGNVSWQEKLVQLADSMDRLRARHYVVSGLDDIAWLLNLRGNDILMSPLFKAYLFISLTNTPMQSLAATLSSKQPSVEQLLLQQTVGATSGGILQSPQVVQVQPNQVIRVTFYVDLRKITPKVREHLHIDNGTVITTTRKINNGKVPPQTLTTRIQVELKDYDVFIMDLRDKMNPPMVGATLSANSVNGQDINRQLQGRLLLEAKANVAIHVLAKTHEERLILLEGLITKLKSVKSDSEVNGMRLAHWRDSLAISMLLAQLEEDIERRGLLNKWTETGAASELEIYRSLMDYNKGQSFPSISAYGSQAAIVHYQPREEDHFVIKNESTYLLDTGGQYLDGTTDITRTAHFGKPSNFQSEAYTRVLMGAIDMMSLVWEQPTRSSFRLNDLLARRHLFELGLDYKHGTGHGIGLYSLVHENPKLIEHYTTVSSAKRSANSEATAINTDIVLLQPNMFSSVEPGYYKANDFGIRLENIVVTQRIILPASLIRQNDRAEKLTTSDNNNKSFLRFEPISLVPFEPKLIKLELLSNKQKAWLNSYNLMVRLRMTQQINYYISKIRDFGSSSTVNKTNDGYYNFLNMDSELLREKLERTHRWILSKTELIPLDVPQSLLPIESTSKTRMWSQEKQDKEEQQQSATTSKAQRLMLTYMSSLPFNDVEAAEAVVSLQDAKLSGRVEANSGKNSTSNPKKQDKCVGLDCDLWLLDAMNSIAAAAVANKQSASSSEARQEQPTLGSKQGHSLGMPTSWSESLMEQDERFIPSSLADLFQLNNSRSLFSSINMWPILVLALLVSLQLLVMAYMCRSRCHSSSCSRSMSNSRPTINRAPSSGSNHCRATSSTLAQQAV